MCRLFGRSLNISTGFCFNDFLSHVLDAVISPYFGMKLSNAFPRQLDNVSKRKFELESEQFFQINTRLPESHMRIIVVTPFHETDWEWFGKDYDGQCWVFKNLRLYGRRPWIWLYEALKAAKSCKDFDLVVSHHPYMTLYLSIGLSIMGISKPHFSFTFNHGNGRFFRGMMLFLAKSYFRKINGFVVYSEQEKSIYSKYYDIPISKMSFVHWAVNAPEIKMNLPEYINQHRPYVCCIGRNNRDLAVFNNAVRHLGINAIIVCNKGQVEENLLPIGTIVKYDIEFDEAMQILANSCVSVVPLRDASTGAGHMTIVSAMQLGVPQIITRLSTVEDYFIDNVHGLFVEQGNVESLINALSKLLKSPCVLKKASENSKEFAEKWLMEVASRKFLKKYIRCIQLNLPMPNEPEGWKEYMRDIRLRDNSLM